MCVIIVSTRLTGSRCARNSVGNLTLIKILILLFYKVILFICFYYIILYINISLSNCIYDSC